MRRLAAALAALAVAVGGCAGDDPPTREEYAEHADRICREGERRLEDIANEASSPKEVADAVDRVIEETRASIDELEKLELPEGEGRALAERFVEGQSEVGEKGIPLLEDLRDALEASDEAAARDVLARLQELEVGRSNQLARRLGADACAG